MRFVKAVILIMCGLCSTAYTDEGSPVSYHLSFEDFKFLDDDYIHQRKLKTIEQRKLQLVKGRFDKGLYLGSIPASYTETDDMSGKDVDFVTALRSRDTSRRNEPFIWGAGKLHPAYGCVAFWVKGPLRAGSLFYQSALSWGRKEKELIDIRLEENGSISAYVEDARYVQHAIRTSPVWKPDRWNHIAFSWDRSSGLSLWVNGGKAASSMGTDSWWENQRTGIFQLPMYLAVYDELYIFDCPLTGKEIKNLFRKNKPPLTGAYKYAQDDEAVSRLKEAFCPDISALPVIRPSNGSMMVFKEIMPERIHDEGVQGWWIADGRYECAWPHEYTIFTFIPGDVDFHADHADVLPPAGEEVNYMTFEGNLDGVTVLAGDRNGNFRECPEVIVPANRGFFFGTTVRDLGDSELRIPFTREYGPAPGTRSDGDVLRLPLSGDLRLHEFTIFNVSEKPFDVRAGDRKMYISPKTVTLVDQRYPSAMKALLPSIDRKTAGLFSSFDDDEPSTIDVALMTRLNIISEPAVEKFPVEGIIIEMWITSPVDDNVLTLKLLDPAVPSHTWTHAEVRLSGFTGKPSRLRIALEFDPVFLVSGDRIWLQVLATDGFSIVSGDRNRPASVILRPAVDRIDAEMKYSYKTMRPNMLTYGRMFEFIPWSFDALIPDVDAPINFGGPFDMAYPWQAVLKVNPGDRLANIYKVYATFEYRRGSRPAVLSNVPHRTFNAPGNAPDWAVYFREVQTFRNRIITWWCHHQRSDGQVGGGWNDDTLVFTRGYGDLPLDSNHDALTLYNNVFDGFDRTGYFKGGYCRIYPIDPWHIGDFVRERFKSLIYNLGDPRSAVWAMEEAWHWEKPDKTPINYGDGGAFQFGKDVMEWYWNRRRIEKPYVLEDREKMIEQLRIAADVHNDITFWRFTDAWCHTDDQVPHGSRVMHNLLNGGFGEFYRFWMRKPLREDSQVTITIGVGWLEGGGPELGRLVEYSGIDGLKVSMYSFDAFERKVIARLFRIDSGLYNVSLRADRDGDGEFETAVTECEQSLRRFDRLELMIPPKVPLKLDVQLIKASPEPADLPDLAISSRYIKKRGTSLFATVHNIGTAPSGPFTVSVFCPHGRELKTVKAGSLPGSQDFVPKKLEVKIPGLPDHPKYQIRIDCDDRIKEIFEENNTLEFFPEP